MNRNKVFYFRPFSQQQRKMVGWWVPNSPVRNSNGIIADGAIRSGKTLSMSLSFALWAMSSFQDQNFAMCGKTVGSFRRNVLAQLKTMMSARGYRVEDRRVDNLVIIAKGGCINYFYIFGGKDERSQDLIQGITLAGVLLDEVALMPQSFVNQATGRCSVEGSKFWFNCNPDGPYHWFKTGWIDKHREKGLLYLHFAMEDNLSMAPSVRERYRSLFTGVFYERYVLGRWRMASGIIYDMFAQRHIVATGARSYSAYYVSCDYGTQNATVFILWGLFQGCWYAVQEYYYSGRDEQSQKTDGEYGEDLLTFIDGRTIQRLIVDPSAASFIAQIRKKCGLRVLKAKNDVLKGIRQTGMALAEDKILFNDCCTNTIREFSAYVWDEKACERGEDKPLKQNDHAMDAVRYFVNTVVYRPTLEMG